MKSKLMLVGAAISLVAAILSAGAAISAQGKYALKVPGGLAFSEFRGFEGWQTCRRQSIWRQD